MTYADARHLVGFFFDPVSADDCDPETLLELAAMIEAQATQAHESELRGEASDA